MKHTVDIGMLNTVNDRKKQFKNNVMVVKNHHKYEELQKLQNINKKKLTNISSFFNSIVYILSHATIFVTIQAKSCVATCPNI